MTSGVQLLRLPLEFRPLHVPGLDNDGHGRALTNLENVIRSWMGTRYQLGSWAKGEKGGVDCIRFVCATFDELDGQQPGRITEIERLPPDTALHKPDKAREVLRRILRLFEPYEHIRDGRYEPGDALVITPPNAGPTHALIATARKNALAHAGRDKVDLHGFMFAAGTGVDVFRVDKRRWAG